MSQGGEGAPPSAAPCPRCGKPAALCVCAALAPVESRVFTLILQHPQEQGHVLGTARLAEAQLVRSRLAIGHSGPSLAAALGQPAAPRRWGVLYPGPRPEGAAPPLTVLGRRGAALPAAEAAAVLAALDGIILLDGSWSQAKALWWRNPWLLKARRLALVPGTPSLYGPLRREPRADSLSTIEAAALALGILEGDSALAERVRRPFALLLERYRAVGVAKRRPAH
jgi:DTW domain-containing protein YfiP